LTNLIEINNLDVVFSNKKSSLTAVKGFSLSVCENEFVSIIGLSGCGKSTVLNLLAGFTKPSGGTMTITGEAHGAGQLRKAMVFQEDAVFPWYTVGENITYALKVAGVGKAECRAAARKYLQWMDLEGFEGFYPKDLSGGMRKRVDLARAYASNPRLLLMDEPFGALDSFTRQQMQDQLALLCEKEYKTIVFVTHDINEAIFLSDRVVVMSPRPGHVQAVYTVPFERPRTAAVKRTAEFLKLSAEIEDLLMADLKNE
jgi:NitT/TauT family transport system ATP-binding protein